MPMQGDDRLWREKVLRKAVLAGDELAWRTWYDGNQASLMRYVHWRFGNNVAAAEEAAQETWLIAVRRIRTFDPAAGSFRNWLFGIAANVIRNVFKKRGGFLHPTASLNGHVEVTASQQRNTLADADCVALVLDQLTPRH